MDLQFRPLTDDDLPLLHGWLNEPGVVAWWEGDDVSWEGVVRDYGSGNADAVEHWVATVDGRPLGWIQCWAAADHLEEDEVRHWRALGVDDAAAGIDYLVGDPADRGQGLGSLMVQHFVHAIVFGRHPTWTQACASPLAANTASVGALARAGFRPAGTFDDDLGTCQLMVFDRTDSAGWWEEFFDEGYVDTWAAAGVFDHDERAAADLLAFLDLPAGARVLDVPCGFGRFAAPLRAAGLEVVGVDASPAQVRLAAERNPGPDYLVGDMREPPPGPFDAVVNLFSSFGYFADPADDARCLRAWHDVLRPGGRLVMELMHRDAVARLWGGDGPAGRDEVGTTDWVTGMRTASVEVAGRRRVFRVRLYTATTLVGMLHEAGFDEVDVRGGLDGRAFDPSTRLAIRARRS